MTHSFIYIDEMFSLYINELKLIKIPRFNLYYKNEFCMYVWVYTYVRVCFIDAESPQPIFSKFGSQLFKKFTVEAQGQKYGAPI